MTDGHGERKLAAIFAADVVGYSRLMSADEEGTLASLNSRRRELFEPLIAKHRGRVVKTTGDGLISEFQSVVEAVRCAVAIQAGMGARNVGIAEDRRLDFRIGIHVGDVIEQDGDVYGDGVNIAARLEGIAEPGGIYVSERVQEDAAGKTSGVFEDLGVQTLKNISRPVRVFRWRPEEIAGDSSPKRLPLGLPDRPSIAVLPFQNMSGDVEQDYFADGMVEEIITALSRMRWLFVIARNSSFTYKGRAVDVKQVGRELGVRYVLEGSVRKAGSKVRITGQLVDASTGAHLWAERFDGGLDDIFDLQDQVTAMVVGAIAPKLEQAEIERAKRKPTESLDAYDYFLRGMAAFNLWTREGNSEALSMLYKAIELDAGFATAHGVAARCYSQRKSGGWVTDRAFEIAEASRLARRAAELGRDDAVALFGAGIAFAYVVGDLDTGVALIDRALALDPNLAGAWFGSGLVKVWLGEPEVAIEREARAMRLSPHDPLTSNMQSATAAGHFFSGRYAEALSWAEMAMQTQSNSIPSTVMAAASAALVGNHVAAAKAMARLGQLMPGLRVSNLKDLWPIRRSEDLDRWAEGMRKAGLPE